MSPSEPLAAAGLYDELLRLFPALGATLNPDNRNLPYVLMGDLVYWLRSLDPIEHTPDLITRLVQLRQRCEGSSSTESAADDLYTIWIVGLYEDLLKTRRPERCFKLAKRDELIANADYLKSWVGSDNYKAASACFS